MNFALAVAGTYGHILLGKRSRMDFIGAVACIIFGAAVFIWQSGKISRYKAKRRHMKKRITAVITKRERIEIYVRSSKPVYRYLYTFTGLGEYEGVTFCDESLLLENVHVEGETVTFLINPENPEEFWFEEEDAPSVGYLICSAALIFMAFWMVKITIEDWERLSSGIETQFMTIAFGTCLILFLFVCIRMSVKASRYEKMKQRMTKRINAVVSYRWAPDQYTEGIPYRYRYTFTGLDEYEGVKFDGMPFRVKKKYELGETVSLLVNANNPKEFWFEKADDPWKMAVALWELWALLLFLYILAVLFVVIPAWNSLPMF